MTPKAKAAGMGTRTAFRTAHETHHSARPNDEQGGGDLYAIEMRLPHEVELAIRRLDYRKVVTICASDVAAETLRKLERHTRLDADAREYLQDGACFLARDALRRRWGLAMNVAKEQASRLLTNANLRALIEKLQRNQSAPVGLIQKAVIAGLVVLR